MYIVSNTYAPSIYLLYQILNTIHRYCIINFFSFLAKPCTATEVVNSNKSSTGAIVGNTGDVVAVVCNAGYSGSGNATCGTNGTFSIVTCTGKIFYYYNVIHKFYFQHSYINQAPVKNLK